MKVKITTPFYGTQEGRWLRRGEVLTVSKQHGEQMVARGLAKPVRSRKRKQPAEDKAARPSENKGIELEGQSG